MTEHRDRLVPIDERLTAPIPPPDFVARTWLDCAVMSVHYRHRYEAYHERMAQIREASSD